MVNPDFAASDFAALSDAEAVALAVKMAAGTAHEQNAREHVYALEDGVAYDRDATNCFLASLAALTPIAALCNEYAAWVEAQGLPHLSADDQDPCAMDPDQRAWLQNFIERWDEAND